MSSTDESGLGLFDDAASAAGNFPAALRGYDRTAVDDYVRSLEASVVASRRRAAELEQQAGALQRQLTEARQGDPEVDYSNLGGRATDILRLAEEQAHELVERATADAERLREVARREADAIRESAARDGGTVKSNGLAELEQLRLQLQADAQAQLDKARAEAGALVAAAKRQAEALRRESAHEAQSVRQAAYLDTENLRRRVEREVAETRQAIATEREQAVAHLRTMHEETAQKVGALLAEATQHNQASAERLEADMAEAARIRESALADAQQTRVAAAAEAEERVAAAKKQAAAITERTQQEFAWRKQQLKRETDLLAQRKQAVLNQLASLSALAEQTAHAFPELDDLAEFDAEQGDQTVLRAPSAKPAAPEAETTARNPAVVSDAKPRPQPPADPAELEDIPLDGDATVLVRPGTPPAGVKPGGAAGEQGGPQRR